MMERNSSGPTCASAWMPKEFAGIADVMNRDSGIANWRLPTSTRRTISSSNPWYQRLMVLLELNSRSVSKSTFRCSRSAMTPLARSCHCCPNSGVGKVFWQPDDRLEISKALQFRFRSLSTLVSNLALSSSVRSAARARACRPPAPCSAESGAKGRASASGSPKPDASWLARCRERTRSASRRVSSAQRAATAAGKARGARRPPGPSAGWTGSRNGCEANWNRTPTPSARPAWPSRGAGEHHQMAMRPASATRATFNVGQGYAPVAEWAGIGAGHTKPLS